MIFLNSLVVYVGAIGSVLLQTVVMMLSLPVYILIEKQTAKLAKHWQQLIFASFIVVWSIGFTLLWRETRARTIRDIQMIAGFMNWGLLNLLVASVIFVVGWIAYWAKKTHQFRYGVVEILVAVITAMISANGISHNPDTFTRIATIAGCVYIVSRGLENMAKYDEEKSKKQVQAPQPCATMLDLL